MHAYTVTRVVHYAQVMPLPGDAAAAGGGTFPHLRKDALMGAQLDMLVVSYAKDSWGSISVILVIERCPLIGIFTGVVMQARAGRHRLHTQAVDAERIRGGSHQLRRGCNT